MKVTIKFEGEDELMFVKKLQESGMNKSEFIRSCILKTNVISQKDKNRDKELYQGIYKVKEAVDTTKTKHKKANMEEVERSLNELCHILLNA